MSWTHCTTAIHDLTHTALMYLPYSKYSIAITEDMLQNANIKHMDMVFIYLHLHLFVSHHPRPTTIFRNPNYRINHHPHYILDRRRPVSIPFVLLDNKDIIKVLVTILYENSRVNTTSY